MSLLRAENPEGMVDGSRSSLCNAVDAECSFGMWSVYVHEDMANTAMWNLFHLGKQTHQRWVSPSHLRICHGLVDFCWFLRQIFKTALRLQR